MLNRYVLSAVGFAFCFSLKAQEVRISIKVPEFKSLSDQIRGSLDLAGYDHETRHLDVITSFENFKMLHEQGHDVELIEQKPLRVDERYLTYEEVASILLQAQQDYPDLVQVMEIGKSFLGRPLLAARVSVKSEHVARKPSVLFNSMHHAREVMTPEIGIDMLQYLTSNYNNPEMPWVQAWLDDLQVWIVPMLNPDGNWMVWNEDTWWRKNARGDARRTWGTDLNRNYPYEWGACGGSSGSPSSDTYRGAEPASEPETRALMNLVASEKFVANLSYHSFSELVIAPYGCRGSYTPEKFIVDWLGKGIARNIKRDRGSQTYRYGTGWEILYPVDGDDISWMYQEHNVLAYVVELNGRSQGFQPDYDRWRDSTVQRNRPAWYFMLNAIARGPRLSGVVTDAHSGELIDAELHIVGLEYSQEKPRKTKSGVYHKLLVAGEYEFEFRADGYETLVVPVSMGQEPLELEVALQKIDIQSLWN